MNETSKSLAALRKNYTLGQLSEDDVPKDPIALFETWFAQASRAQCPEPNAMALATANQAGIPSVRIVLLKAADHGSFTFFTNYESQKGKELAAQPHASLLFHWHELERQVRINGTVERVSAAESDAYFHSRPPASRIGAWASPQSQVIDGRGVLVTNAAKYAAQFMLNPPRPPHWGGFRVTPERMEFWEDRAHRLHHRRLFLRSADGWTESLLYP